MALETFFIKKGVELIGELGKNLLNIRTERQDEIDAIENICGPLDNLIPYYVEPDGQNVNPADLEEDSIGLIAANPILSMLDTFLVDQKRFTHAFILSDAGMGKTSLLVMLKLAFLNKFVQSKCNVVLFKLGKKSLKDIKKIKNPASTILLLDALDEDPEAWDDFHKRIGDLLRASQKFRKVVISCRTQFFPKDQEEDSRIPGIFKLHGFYCFKLFLSPFNDEKVAEYLKRRFRKKKEREKANVIMEKMHFLKFRPMLLSHIDLLIPQNCSFDTAYEVYQAMVEEWLDREIKIPGKSPKDPIVSGDEKNLLFSACMAIAKHLYDKNEPWINHKTMQDILSAELLDSIDSMKIGGRSLLHRTSESL
jgi:hypothetical protein